MRSAQYASIDSENTIEEVTVRQLRLWSAPQIIMVATNLADELLILPHVILQARQSNATIQLVHVLDAAGYAPKISTSSFQDRSFRRCAVRPILDRMAQHFRWVGIKCEPVVLTGNPEVAIPFFAKTRGADRLIVGFKHSPDLTTPRSRTFTERILPVMDIPVCAIGRHVSLLSPTGLKAKNVTLAVSLNSDYQVHLGFASRLAQEAHANLSVLHVNHRQHSNVDGSSPTAAEVKSRLPSETWREAEMFCPVEISIREGDPAEEILTHNSSQKEGFVVLCSAGIPPAGQIWRNSVSYRVVAEARYPVFILKRRMPVAEIVKGPEKSAAVNENPTKVVRRDKVTPHFPKGRQ